MKTNCWRPRAVKYCQSDPDTIAERQSAALWDVQALFPGLLLKFTWAAGEGFLTDTLSEPVCKWRTSFKRVPKSISIKGPGGILSHHLLEMSQVYFGEQLWAAKVVVFFFSPIHLTVCVSSQVETQHCALGRTPRVQDLVKVHWLGHPNQTISCFSNSGVCNTVTTILALCYLMAYTK